MILQAAMVDCNEDVKGIKIGEKNDITFDGDPHIALGYNSCQKRSQKPRKASHRVCDGHEEARVVWA